MAHFRNIVAAYRERFGNVELPANLAEGDIGYAEFSSEPDSWNLPSTLIKQFMGKVDGRFGHERNGFQEVKWLSDARGIVRSLDRLVTSNMSKAGILNSRPMKDGDRI